MSGKRREIQYTQLRLAFATKSRGETLDADCQRTEPLVTKRTPVTQTTATSMFAVVAPANV